MCVYPRCDLECAKRDMLKLNRPHLVTLFAEDYGEVRAAREPGVLIHFGGTETREDYKRDVSGVFMVPVYHCQEYVVSESSGPANDLMADDPEGDAEGDEDLIEEPEPDDEGGD